MARRSIYWLVVVVACAGCAAQPSSPGSSATSTVSAAPGPGPSVTAGSSVTPLSSTDRSTASRVTGDVAGPPAPSGRPPVTGTMTGSCPADAQLGYIKVLQGVSAGATTVTGIATATGRHSTAMLDDFSTGDPLVYAEVSVWITQQLIGPRLPDHVTVHLPGGVQDGRRTTVDRILESAWATDGAFFGTIGPSSAFPGEHTMDVLPLIGSAITFLGTGCITPTGLTITRRSVSVLTMDDGYVVPTTGTFPTVSLTEVQRLLK